MGRAGKALNQVLKKYDISQSQLAAKMSIDRSTIHRWANESRDPTAEAIVSIRNALTEMETKAGEEFIKLFLD